MSERRGSWLRGTCVKCGSEELVTRGDPATVPDDYTCPTCKAYDKGYADGVIKALEVLKELLV